MGLWRVPAEDVDGGAEDEHHDELARANATYQKALHKRSQRVGDHRSDVETSSARAQAATRAGEAGFCPHSTFDSSDFDR